MLVGHMSLVTGGGDVTTLAAKTLLVATMVSSDTAAARALQC